MPQDTQDMLLEIKESIASIKITIENIMPTVDLKLENIGGQIKDLDRRVGNLEELKIETADEKIKVINHRISDLEEHNKWIGRAVIGAIIIQVVILFFK